MVIRYITAIVLAVTLGACASKMTPPPEIPLLQNEPMPLVDQDGAWCGTCLMGEDVKGLRDFFRAYEAWKSKNFGAE